MVVESRISEGRGTLLTICKAIIILSKRLHLASALPELEAIGNRQSQVTIYFGATQAEEGPLMEVGYSCSFFVSNYTEILSRPGQMKLLRKLQIAT
jgi:hypothetical protein